MGSTPRGRMSSPRIFSINIQTRWVYEMQRVIKEMTNSRVWFKMEFGLFILQKSTLNTKHFSKKIKEFTFVSS